jgi:hypothetical protein
MYAEGQQHIVDRARQEGHEMAGRCRNHSVEVLHKVYAKCLDGQDKQARDRMAPDT